MDPNRLRRLVGRFEFRATTRELPLRQRLRQLAMAWQRRFLGDAWRLISVADSRDLRGSHPTRGRGPYLEMIFASASAGEGDQRDETTAEAQLAKAEPDQAFGIRGSTVYIGDLVFVVAIAARFGRDFDVPRHRGQHAHRLGVARLGDLQTGLTSQRFGERPDGWPQPTFVIIAVSNRSTGTETSRITTSLQIL